MDPTSRSTTGTETAYVLAENRAMLDVFENAGFPLERRLEGNVIVATLGLDTYNRAP